MVAFIVWAICGLFFVGMGIFEFFPKRKSPLGFGQMPRPCRLKM